MFYAFKAMSLEEVGGLISAVCASSSITCLCPMGLLPCEIVKKALFLTTFSRLSELNSTPSSEGWSVFNWLHIYSLENTNFWKISEVIWKTEL